MCKCSLYCINIAPRMESLLAFRIFTNVQRKLLEMTKTLGPNVHQLRVLMSPLFYLNEASNWWWSGTSILSKISQDNWDTVTKLVTGLINMQVYKLSIRVHQRASATLCHY